jgi:hypothetical protein
MEGRSLNLWHALRRECSGAWRSVRYDLATNRAAKVAGGLRGPHREASWAGLAEAFTEEFEPGRAPVPTPSRLVPLTGVTLLLAGGAAGAFLAITGGLAAVDGPDGSSPARQYAATASPTTTAAATGNGGGASAGNPRRAAAAPRTSLSPGPATLPPPASPPPIVEASSLPPSSVAASASASSPAPSASESSQANTEGPRSRGHRGRR